MAEVNTVNVIVLVGGIVNSLKAYDNPTEAEVEFRKQIESRDNNITENEIIYHLGCGDFEYSDHNIVLCHSDGGS
jgi:hypothetical protein